MSFGLYSIGFLVVIAGVAYLAHLMHIPQTYIVATVVILLGIGIVTGVMSTRGKDPN
jgi:energy-converting hydrogenase Eha subunit C